MKIAIISDTHDAFENTRRLVAKLNNDIRPDLVIHCGDLISPFMIKQHFKDLKAPMHMCLGYNDGDVFELSRLAAASKGKFTLHRIGELEIDGRKACFVHDYRLAEPLALEGKSDIIFCGHSHAAEIKEINGRRIVNPGEIAGALDKPTYAIWDTKADKVKIEEL